MAIGKKFSYLDFEFNIAGISMVTVDGFNIDSMEASGISSPDQCSNVDTDNAVISLCPEAFLGSEGLTVTGNPYKFEFVLAQSVCASGMSGGICTGGSLNDVKFYGSDNSEKITNFNGTNVCIDGGAGDDVLVVEGASVSGSSVQGGEGDDKIFINGSSVLVDGGVGNDIVVISGDDVTVDVSEGTDLISIGAGVTNISVTGFESSDQITFTENVTSISGISDGLLVQLDSGVKVSVMGLSYSEAGEENGKWEYGELPNAVVAGTSGLKYVVRDEFDKGNVFFNGTDLHVNAGTDSSKDQTLVEIAGVSAVAAIVDYFSPENESFVNTNNETIKTVNITSPIITSDNSVSILSNDGEYVFKIDDDVSAISFYGLSAKKNIIGNGGGYVSVYGGQSDDYIINGAATAVFISSGNFGNDTLLNLSGAGVTLKGSPHGINSINNYGSGCVLIGGDKADTISHRGPGQAKIDSGDGNDDILSLGMASSINGGSGINLITLEGDKSTVEASQGVNNIYVVGSGGSVKDLYVGGFSSSFGKCNTIYLDKEIVNVEYKEDDYGEEYSKFNLADKTFIRIYGLDELTHDNVKKEEGWAKNSNGSWSYYAKSYEDVGTVYKNDGSGGSMIYYQPASKK